MKGPCGALVVMYAKKGCLPFCDSIHFMAWLKKMSVQKPLVFTKVLLCRMAGSKYLLPGASPQLPS